VVDQDLMVITPGVCEKFVLNPTSLSVFLTVSPLDDNLDPHIVHRRLIFLIEKKKRWERLHDFHNLIRDMSK
jgi:hypothetical protein